ncbi:MGA_1079 family surface serine endopeptidase [Mycoplasmopsis verecunda]|uniref:Chromosome segregation ATPase n=1 Tax=Mycoplasmopsis verecunda TaxID=171291 RepID=A0A1T4M0U1_9BACT|nr:hypothetical protein [Mycoplasmopsis verecunda]WPB54747.1 hypothetical protein SAM46_01150 [Mycoplasmopsis verecunda]SJZ60599.1 Chromosome segregation ATPase [Mycoplasmopsis verecunda]
MSKKTKLILLLNIGIVIPATGIVATSCHKPQSTITSETIIQQDINAIERMKLTETKNNLLKLQQSQMRDNIIKIIDDKILAIPYNIKYNDVDWNLIKINALYNSYKSLYSKLADKKIFNTSDHNNQKIHIEQLLATRSTNLEEMESILNSITHYIDSYINSIDKYNNLLKKFEELKEKYLSKVMDSVIKTILLNEIEHQITNIKNGSTELMSIESAYKKIYGNLINILDLKLDVLLSKNDDFKIEEISKNKTLEIINDSEIKFDQLEEKLVYIKQLWQNNENIITQYHLKQNNILNIESKFRNSLSKYENYIKYDQTEISNEINELKEQIEFLKKKSNLTLDDIAKIDTEAIDNSYIHRIQLLQEISLDKFNSFRINNLFKNTPILNKIISSISDIMYSIISNGNINEYKKEIEYQQGLILRLQNLKTVRTNYNEWIYVEQTNNLIDKLFKITNLHTNEINKLIDEINSRNFIFEQYKNSYLDASKNYSDIKFGANLAFKSKFVTDILKFAKNEYDKINTNAYFNNTYSNLAKINDILHSYNELNLNTNFNKYSDNLQNKIKSILDSKYETTADFTNVIDEVNDVLSNYGKYDSILRKYNDLLNKAKEQYPSNLLNNLITLLQSQIDSTNRYINYDEILSSYEQLNNIVESYVNFGLKNTISSYKIEKSKQNLDFILNKNITSIQELKTAISQLKSTIDINAKYEDLLTKYNDVWLETNNSYQSDLLKSLQTIIRNKILQIRNHENHNDYLEVLQVINQQLNKYQELNLNNFYSDSNNSLQLRYKITALINKSTNDLSAFSQILNNIRLHINNNRKFELDYNKTLEKLKKESNYIKAQILKYNGSISNQNQDLLNIKLINDKLIDNKANNELFDNDELDKIISSIDLNNIHNKYVDIELQKLLFNTVDLKINDLFSDLKNEKYRLEEYNDDKTKANTLIEKWHELKNSYLNNPSQTALDKLTSFNIQLDSDISNIKNSVFIKYANLNLEVKLHEDKHNYDIKPSSASITDDNFWIYLDENVSDKSIQYKRENYHIDKDDPNTLIINYRTVADNKTLNIAKRIKFDDAYSGIEKLISDFEPKTLDDIYNINYYNLAFLSTDDLNINDKILPIFSNKNIDVNRYFDLQIQINSIKLNNNKLQATIKLLHNNYEIKEFLLESNQTVTLQNPYQYLIQVEPTERYQKTEFYKKPFYKASGITPVSFWLEEILSIASEFNYAIPYTINNDVPIEFFIMINTVGRIQNLNSIPASLREWFRNNQYSDEMKIKIHEQFIRRNFKIKTQETLQWSLSTYKQNEQYASFENDKNLIKYNLTVNINSKTLKGSFNFSTGDYQSENINDYLNATYMLSLPQSSNNKVLQKAIFEKTTSKNPQITHSNIVAWQVASKLNDIYNWPTFGRYQLQVDESQPNIVDKINGTAQIRFVILDTKTNTLVTKYDPMTKQDIVLKSQSFKLEWFKKFDQFDVEKKGEIWTDNDFITSDAKLSKYQRDIALARMINSTNITYRNGYRTPNNRMIDVATLLEEQSFDKMPYMFKFINSDKELKNSQNESGPNNDSNIIQDSADKINNVDIEYIKRNYYIYFIDVSGEHNSKTKLGHLRFKLGFINKKDNDIRFTSDKYINLYNLQNDYYEEYYPNMMLNMISRDELNLDLLDVSNITVEQFISQDMNVINSWLQNHGGILKYNLNYNNRYEIEKELISIEKVWRVPNETNSVFITLKYQNSNRVINGTTWYQIKGFKQNHIYQASDSTIINSLGRDRDIWHARPENLKTIFKSNGDILRHRNVDLNINDNLWDITPQQAKWTLPKQYYTDIMDNVNNRDKWLNLHLFSNIVFWDDAKEHRIFSLNAGLNFDINYDELKQKGTLFIDTTTSAITDKNNITHQIPVRLEIKYTNEGIEFIYKSLDPQYSIVADNLRYDFFSDKVPRDKENTLNQNGQLYIDRNGSLVSMRYTNNIVNEKFSSNPTNIISYKNLDYNEKNSPYYLYSEDRKDNVFKYNPNQNVEYKLHNGYKFPIEIAKKQYYADPLVAESNDRLLGMFIWPKAVFDSIYVLGKVNNDPKDGRFYAVTNEHVVKNDRIRWQPQKAFEDEEYLTTVTLMKKPDLFTTEIDGGSTHQAVGLNGQRGKVNIVWTGYSQIGYKRNVKRNDKTLIKDKFVDITVLEIDIIPFIQQAKLDGKFALANYFEKWFTFKNKNLTDYIATWSGATAYNDVSVTWSSFGNFQHSSHIVNRLSTIHGAYANGDAENGIRWFIHDYKFMPIYDEGGSSGSGLVDTHGNYISTFNSSTSNHIGVSWSNTNDSFNYFGLNYNNEHPLDLINSKSLVRNILKLNAYNPKQHLVPWWVKKPNN